MSKQVNVDFVTRQIEVDTDGKEHFISAAMAAKDANAAAVNAQNAAAEVKEIYKDGMFTPLSDLLGGLGTKLKRWGAIFANKVFATNLPIVYKSVAEMKSDTNLWVGMSTKTLGYYSPNDGGGASYLIREKQESDISDSGSLHFLSNGLVAELVVENGTVNVKQFGAKGDGVTDDTDAVQKAFDSANMMFIPQGTYICRTLEISNRNSLTIFGEYKSSIIKAKGIDAIPTTVLSFVNCDNVIVNNFKIDGDKKYKVTPLSFVNCSDVDVSLMYITGASNQRSLNVQTFTTKGENIYIHDNYLTNYGDIIDGGLIYCTGESDGSSIHYLKNLRICNNTCIIKEGNYVGNNDLLDCIEVDNTIGTVISNNYCYNIFHNGISVDTRNIDFIVANNQCQNALRNGIDITGAYGETTGIVEGNIINNSGTHGIQIDGQEDIVVINNKIFNSGLRGILLDNNCKRCLVSNNVIRTASETGIYIGGAPVKCQLLYNYITNITGTDNKKDVYISSGSGGDITIYTYPWQKCTIDGPDRISCRNGIYNNVVPVYSPAFMTEGSGLRFYNKDGTKYIVSMTQG